MKDINTESGFIKMYWDLFNDPDLTTDAVVILSYILSVYPILKERQKDKQGLEYRKVTDSFIQEKLWEMSSHRIRQAMNILIDTGYVSRLGGKNTKLPRFIRISDSIKQYINDCIN